MTELRLSEAVLDNLPLDVGRPNYDRRSVRPGVVHLGVGAFHRAHQAAVFETLIASGDERWGVRGASLRSPAVRDQLRPQDGLYSLVVRDGDEEAVRIIGALQDVLVAPEDPEALIEALAHPDAHLATLTVTFGGRTKFNAARTSLALGGVEPVKLIGAVGAPPGSVSLNEPPFAFTTLRRCFSSRAVKPVASKSSCVASPRLESKVIV